MIRSLPSGPAARPTSLAFLAPLLALSLGSLGSLGLAGCGSSGAPSAGSRFTDVSLGLEAAQLDESFEVAFQAVAPGAATFEFDFDDGVVETSDDGAITHDFRKDDRFTVQVKAMSAAGSTLARTERRVVVVDFDKGESPPLDAGQDFDLEQQDGSLVVSFFSQVLNVETLAVTIVRGDDELVLGDLASTDVLDFASPEFVAVFGAIGLTTDFTVTLEATGTDVEGNAIDQRLARTLTVQPVVATELFADFTMKVVSGVELPRDRMLNASGSEPDLLGSASAAEPLVVEFESTSSPGAVALEWDFGTPGGDVADLAPPFDTQQESYDTADYFEVTLLAEYQTDEGLVQVHRRKIVSTVFPTEGVRFDIRWVATSGAGSGLGTNGLGVQVGDRITADVSLLVAPGVEWSGLRADVGWNTFFGSPSAFPVNMTLVEFRQLDLLRPADCVSVACRDAFGEEMVVDKVPARFDTVRVENLVLRADSAVDLRSDPAGEAVRFASLDFVVEKVEAYDASTLADLSVLPAQFGGSCVESPEDLLIRLTTACPNAEEERESCPAENVSSAPFQNRCADATLR